MENETNKQDLTQDEIMDIILSSFEKSKNNLFTNVSFSRDGGVNIILSSLAMSLINISKQLEEQNKQIAKNTETLENINGNLIEICNRLR